MSTDLRQADTRVMGLNQQLAESQLANNETRARLGALTDEVHRAVADRSAQVRGRCWGGVGKVQEEGGEKLRKSGRRKVPAGGGGRRRWPRAAQRRWGKLLGRWAAVGFGALTHVLAIRGL